MKELISFPFVFANWVIILLIVYLSMPLPPIRFGILMFAIGCLGAINNLQGQGKFK